MKHLLFFLVYIILIVTAAPEISSQELTPKHGFKFWVKFSSDTNKMLPINVDSETILFSSAPQANGITWHYKVINSRYSDMPAKRWDDFLADVAKESIERFCTSPDSVLFRDSNASIKINYYDRNGKYIGKISFEAGKDCVR